MSEKKRKMTISDVIDSMAESFKKEAMTEEDEAAILAAEEAAAARAQEEEEGEGDEEGEEYIEDEGEEYIEDEEVDEEAEAAQIAEATQAAKEQAIEEAAQVIAEASKDQVAAVESLKEIAKQASENENTLLKKEASMFGKIFAKSLVSTLEKKALEEEVFSGAYASTMESIEDAKLSKYAEEVYTDSYINTLSTLAALESYNLALDKCAELNSNVMDGKITAIVKEAYDMTIAECKK
jgi:hypothetical protein